MLQSKLLSQIAGIEHGFGTSEIPFPIHEIWKTKLPKWKQVHGIAIAEITQLNQDVGEVDALFARQKRLPLAIVTADCVPLLLVRKDGQAVAGAHAGWRGTQRRIAHELLKRLKESGEDLSNWVGAVGPAIGPCCYEVSEVLAEEFKTQFTKLGFGLANPKYRALDLPSINAWEMSQMGVGGVDVIRLCTKCSGGAVSPVFHSYRRDGSGGRQWSVVVGK